MKTRNKNVPENNGRFLWLLIPLSAVLAALILNNFVILSAIVPSASMADTIAEDSLILASRLAYISETPKRGDVIIFSHPEIDERYVLKRVVALPGETLMIQKGRVYINSAEVPLEEEYIDNFSDDDYLTVTVPEDCYFVLGDNRGESFDSRFWDNPFVKIENIYAKTEFVLFPTPKIIK